MDFQRLPTLQRKEEDKNVSNELNLFIYTYFCLFTYDHSCISRQL